MAEEPDVIRQQIEETRESLTEKLDTLEGQFKDAVGTVTDTIETVKNSVECTVESVRSGVEDTVESVKTSLGDTVDSVKESLDLSRQIDRHPWGAVGCSLLAGVAAGYFFARPGQAYWPNPRGIPGMDSLIPGYQPARPLEAPPPPRSEPGVLANLLGSFEGELGKIKQTAIGAVMAIVRDKIKEVLPPALAENVTEIMDSATRAAGGEPIHGSLLQREPSGRGDGVSRAAS